MSLVGIDLGTSGIRAVAVSVATGREVAEVARPTTLHRPAPGAVEIDAEECLRIVVALLGALAGRAEVAADPVEALAFSVQGEAVVPVDAYGHALAPAPVSMDQRGARAAALVAETLGATEVQRLSGQPLHQMFSIYKIAMAGGVWDSSAVRGYRCLGDFVAARLGARPALDTTMAARTGGFDVLRREWSTALLGALDIPVSRFPEVVPPGTVIGKLTADVAATTGLPAGLPIVVGSHDQACSFWGAGGRAGVISVYSLGSSDCLTVGSDGRPPGLGGTGLATYPVTGAGAGTGSGSGSGGGSDHWLTLAGTAAGGWTLDWFAALVHAATPAERDALFTDAAAHPPDLLVLPYLAGSGTIDNDPLARGAIVGLTLETTREQVARAFLESAGFELRKIVETLAEFGLPVGAVLVVGGGARDGRSLAIRAAAAGLPLTPVPGSAAARGAALAAGVGIGRYESVAGLPAPALAPATEPDPRTAGWYAAQAQRYRALYPMLVPHDRSYRNSKETW